MRYINSLLLTYLLTYLLTRSGRGSGVRDPNAGTVVLWASSRAGERVPDAWTWDGGNARRRLVEAVIRQLLWAVTDAQRPPPAVDASRIKHVHGRPSGRGPAEAGRGFSASAAPPCSDTPTSPVFSVRSQCPHSALSCHDVVVPSSDLRVTTTWRLVVDKNWPMMVDKRRSLRTNVRPKTPIILAPSFRSRFYRRRKTGLWA